MAFCAYGSVPNSAIVEIQNDRMHIVTLMPIGAPIMRPVVEFLLRYKRVSNYFSLRAKKLFNHSNSPFFA